MRSFDITEVEFHADQWAMERMHSRIAWYAGVSTPGIGALLGWRADD